MALTVDSHRRATRSRLVAKSGLIVALILGAVFAAGPVLRPGTNARFIPFAIPAGSSALPMANAPRLAFEVREILKTTGHTAILVTHNQAEAFAIADRIGVMSAGRIVQWDTPYNLHHHPVDGFVADFIRREALLAQRAEALLR